MIIQVNYSRNENLICISSATPIKYARLVRRASETSTLLEISLPNFFYLLDRLSCVILVF